jgi:hypothetical protein
VAGQGAGRAGRSRRIFEVALTTDKENRHGKEQGILDSPSTAAGVLLGRSANGRIEWKDERGVSLKQLQSGKN